MRNQKLYRQTKAKGIQHHKTSVMTNAKGTSLSGKEKATARNKKITKWESSLVKQTYSKGRKSSTHKYDIKTSNCEILWHKCWIAEMQLKLRDQQPKTIMYTYRLLYQNLMVTTKIYNR